MPLMPLSPCFSPIITLVSFQISPKRPPQRLVDEQFMLAPSIVTFLNVMVRGVVLLPFLLSKIYEMKPPNLASFCILSVISEPIVTLLQFTVRLSVLYIPPIAPPMFCTFELATCTLEVTVGLIVQFSIVITALLASATTAIRPPVSVYFPPTFLPSALIVWLKFKLLKVTAPLICCAQIPPT